MKSKIGLNDLNIQTNTTSEFPKACSLTTLKIIGISVYNREISVSIAFYDVIRKSD